MRNYLLENGYTLNEHGVEYTDVKIKNLRLFNTKQGKYLIILNMNMLNLIYGEQPPPPCSVSPICCLMPNASVAPKVNVLNALLPSFYCLKGRLPCKIIFIFIVFIGL